MTIIDIKNTPLQQVINQTATILQQGGLVIFPTETTYGAGVDATNPAAVEKLLAYKSRREGKPLSIAVTDESMASKYVELNDQARTLYTQFLPGPVTVVSKGRSVVAPQVESEFGTLGVRIPDYPLVLEIVKKLGKPITATSANASGARRPYAITTIFEGLSHKQQNLISLVLDAGELPHRPPSTVIDTTLSTPVTLRDGDLSKQLTLSMQSSQRQLSETPGTTTLISNSETETEAIAGRLMLKHWNDVRELGLIITLDGALGMGKTVFTKGVARFLHISDTISSPTYTYIHEYDFKRHQTTGRLYHLDMWKVDSKHLFDRLELDTLFAPHSVVVIEWYNQIRPFFETTLQRIKSARTQPVPRLINITFDQGDQARLLTVFEPVDSL